MVVLRVKTFEHSKKRKTDSATKPPCSILYIEHFTKMSTYLKKSSGVGRRGARDRRVSESQLFLAAAAQTSVCCNTGAISLKFVSISVLKLMRLNIESTSNAPYRNLCG